MDEEDGRVALVGLTKRRVGKDRDGCGGWQRDLNVF